MLTLTKVLKIRGRRYLGLLSNVGFNDEKWKKRAWRLEPHIANMDVAPFTKPRLHPTHRQKKNLLNRTQIIREPHTKKSKEIRCFFPHHFAEDYKVVYVKRIKLGKRKGLPLVEDGSECRGLMLALLACLCLSLMAAGYAFFSLTRCRYSSDSTWEIDSIWAPFLNFQ